MKNNGSPLPNGWMQVKLEDVCEIILGQSPPSSTYRKRPDGLPFFQGKADFGDVSPTPTTWCVKPHKIAEVGDILISVRAPVGPTNIANTRCCIGRGLAALRCQDSIDRDFLLAGLKLYESEISRMGSGSTFKAITGKQLKALIIPLPPLYEQKRIAAILNDHMADIAHARTAAEAQLEAAEALSAAYLRETFESKEVKEWPNVRLRDLCILVNGKAFKPSDWSTSGKPIIRIQNLNDATKPFNYWDGSLEKQVIVNPGAVLLAWSGTPGTSFGAHIWNREDGVLNQHIFRVDFTRPDISPQWFTYSVNQRLDVLIHQAHGGVGLRHVKKSQVEALEIPLPPLSEQKRIVAIFNDRMADITRACTAIREKLETINQLPSAILRKAFNGEL